MNKKERQAIKSPESAHETADSFTKIWNALWKTDVLIETELHPLEKRPMYPARPKERNETLAHIRSTIHTALSTHYSLSELARTYITATHLSSQSSAHISALENATHELMHIAHTICNEHSELLHEDIFAELRLYRHQ